MQKAAQRRLRISWLLLLVYIPMLIAVTFHHHGEAQRVVPTSFCQDCANHVHHDGHLLVLQHHMHDCVLCQLQHADYLSPALTLLAAVIVFHHIIRKDACQRCKLMPNDVKSVRAPPYL